MIPPSTTTPSDGLQGGRSLLEKLDRTCSLARFTHDNGEGSMMSGDGLGGSDSLRRRTS